MKLKFLKYLPVMVAVALLAVGCVKDDITGGGPYNDGKAKVRLYVDALNFAKPTTRAFEDDIHDIVVLVFEGTGPDAVLEQVDQTTLSGGNITAELNAADGKHTIVVVANLFYNGVFDLMNLTLDDFKVGSTGSLTLRQLEETVPSTYSFNVVMNETNTNLDEQALEMVGVLEVDGIKDGMSIGTPQNPLRLIRDVAKMTVYTNDRFSISNIYMGGAGFGRVMRRYSDLPEFDKPFTLIDASLYMPKVMYPAYGAGFCNMPGGYNISGIEDNVFPETDLHDTEQYPFYAYEVKHTVEPYWPFIIVKGKLSGDDTEYFYKVYFQNAGDAPMDIIRNKHYKFHLNITGPGYTSMAEIIDDNITPSNVNWNIEVNDLSSHDIITNGQHYLGLSNSELVVYDEGGASGEIVATTISTDIVDYLNSSGNYVYAEVMPGSADGISIIGSDLIPTDDGNVYTGDLIIELSDEFAYYEEATVRIYAGSLQRDIKITRNPSLTWAEDPMLIDENVYHAQLGSGNDGSWLTGLTGIPNDESMGQSRITMSTAGPLYACKLINMQGFGETEEALPNTGGEFYYSRQRDDQYGVGRVKVVAQQAVFEADAYEVIDYPWQVAGAFWRHDQTGERFVRFKVPDGVVIDSWGAVIMDGEEWIKLDKQQSLDPGLTWNINTEAPADMSLPENDERYAVTGNYRSVSGGYMEDDQWVYFRIGLKGTCDPEEVRYGRLAIYAEWHLAGNESYANYNFSYIYIRQGEAADYLMRPEDPSDYVDMGGTTDVPRPLAAKFSPFNLTMEGFKGEGSTASVMFTNVNGGQPTDYPTQMGALFKWADYEDLIVGWNPRVNGHGSFTSYDPPTESWEEIKHLYESCPEGYRRPADGPPESGLFAPESDPTLSEMAQSLWLNPPYAYGFNGDNMIRGTYADGFFDRREPQEMVINGNYYIVDYYAAVNQGNSAVAYSGRLLFNPITNASLFFPMGGIIDSGGQRVAYVSTPNDYGGYIGSAVYWSSTSYSNTESWVTYIGGGSTYLLSFRDYLDRNTAASIRCVKIEEE